MDKNREIKDRVEAYLRGKFPERKGLTAVDVSRKLGGFSYQMYFVTSRWTESGSEAFEKLVFRIEPDHGACPPYDIVPQCEVISRLYGKGVPVPKIHFFEAGKNNGVFGHPFIVMEHVEGESLRDTYFSRGDLQHQIEEEYVNTLAKIHGLDWKALGLSVLGASENAREFVEKRMARWEQVHEDVQYTPHPVITAAEIWLRKNIPSTDRITLCHGDYHAENLLVRDGRVVAVNDWELVGIGDPMSDLAWSCIFMNVWRGFYDEKRFIRRYEEVVGKTVDEERLRFWKVFCLHNLLAIASSLAKAGLESKDVDVRGLSGMFMLIPMLQNDMASLLGL